MSQQRKNSLNSFFTAARPPTTETAASPADKARVKSGAIGAMDATLATLREDAGEAARLHEQLRSGEHVVALNTSTIDPSPVVDRLPSANDPAFEQLVDSIQEHGQQVPILVRPHPSSPGRYQIAFGRRRLRALVRLDRPVNAIVRVLSDDELVVAQGKENLDRADLSFVEKVFFAKHLEDAGYSRTTIMAALSTDKSDLSRYLALSRQLPEDLVQKIGPAPKAGRARWTSLADAMSDTAILASAHAETLKPEFEHAGSDIRFLMVLEAATPRTVLQAKVTQWTTPVGHKGVQIQKRGTQTVFTFDEAWVPNLASKVESRLDEIFKELMQEEGDADTD